MATTKKKSNICAGASVAEKLLGCKETAGTCSG